MYDLEQIKEKYNIENEDFLREYLAWCRAQGWVPGSGRSDCKGCKYVSTHNNPDRACMWCVDHDALRPCPPWDCTCWEEGGRKGKRYELV